MPRTKKKAFKGRRGGKPNNDWVERSDVLDMSNERLENYYKAQRIVAEDEWDAFMDALRQPLPSTFRITGNRQMAQALNDTIKSSYVPQLQNTSFEGEPLPTPVPIPWYPDGLAWQISVPRKALRKSAEYKKFHSFLVFETEVGNISRQEAVSMLPPLFLDVEPHHWVIDMCAAPGSKTSQLIEALHANDGIPFVSTPSGLLIANDSDHKRTHLLIHQSSRLPSPALMVTNLDASIYPSIKIPEEIVSSHASRRNTKDDGLEKKMNWRKDRQRQIHFDRILCDVPCSGDGTIRKNPGIWKSWQPLDGNGLHGLQTRILQRAMKMLKDDGRIVYSTCSLNPVENEAVVAAALNSDSSFELIDVSDRLPALIRRPGLTYWCPAVDRQLNMNFESYAKFFASLTDDKQRATTKMLPTHWPPANAKELSLERCLRVYPHLQDSGGFFVAVLQKKLSISAIQVETLGVALDSDVKRPLVELLEPPVSKRTKFTDDHHHYGNVDVDVHLSNERPTIEMAEVSQAPASPKQGSSGKVHEKGKGKEKDRRNHSLLETGGTFKEHPYTFVSPDEPILQSCIARLNLKPDFPIANMYVRNGSGEPIRSLYLVNDIVKAVVQSTDYTHIRLVSAGVKLFGKSEGAKDSKGAALPFRVLSEGLPAVLPYIKQETLIAGDVCALRTLLETYYPLCVAFMEPFRSALEVRSVGSHIVCFKAGKQAGESLTHDLIMPLWKSEVSVSLMIDKTAKSALSLRLFGEDVTIAARLAAQKQKNPGIVDQVNAIDPDNIASETDDNDVAAGAVADFEDDREDV